MSKVEVSNSYFEALDAFRRKLAASLILSGDYEGVETLIVKLETGRKFDKLIVSATFKHAKKDDEVAFFIARASFLERNGHRVTEGDIYGKKSKVAPNFRWFFGDIYSTNDWDWSTKHPMLCSTHAYAEVGTYGELVHYRRHAHA